MKIVESVEQWKKLRPSFSGEAVGFVPTMGALHQGHAALLEQCRRENDISVLSIFVNPAQFDEKSDLENYPRTFEEDCRLAYQKGADYLLIPSPQEMYADGYRYRVSEAGLSQQLCGAHRPGHFDGVLTVVMKFLLLVKANKAYFGEKDYQQLQLVKGMAEAFFVDTQIIPCPTVRDADGLALSSRNARLTPEQREKASAFPQYLKSGLSPAEIVAKLEAAGMEVDYLEQIQDRRFGAVRVGDVRLIDNVEV